MDFEETIKIMAVLKATYPQYYRDATKENLRPSVKVWQTVFKEYDYDLVSHAVMAFIASDIKGFPPAPGMIMDKLQKIVGPNELTELDAWSMVRKAVSNSRYSAEQEFFKLPASVQSAVGDYKTLKAWAEIDEGELDTVIQSNFMRSFKARSQADKEYRSLPSDVKNFIKDLSQGMDTKKLTRGE